MITLRNSVMGALLGLAGLASLAATPAQADLIISCTGQAGCGTLASQSANSKLVYVGGTFGDFDIGPLTILGVLKDAGGLMDVSNLDVNSACSGSCSLNLQFTETNLSAGAAAQFLMDFSATLSGALTDTRTFWLDPTNQGLYGSGNAIFLGSCIGASCSLQLSALESLSGQFSLTEEIALTAGAGDGKLSSDDDISVPEPAALSIFGLGLLVLGAMGWRRRSSGNLAA